MSTPKKKWLVLSVLKTGGDFTANNVYSLRAQVARHFQAPHEFRVLTDAYIRNMYKCQLWHDWPGWWSKLELFNVNRLEKFKNWPCFFLDLDTVITDDFDLPLPSFNELWMIRDFMAWGDDRYRSRWWASGLMTWSGDFTAIPARASHLGIKEVDAQFRWDQIFINKTLEREVAEGRVEQRALNDVIRIESFKVHKLDKDTLDDPPQIVCFHGKPRPWDRHDLTWVKEARAWHL